MRMDAHLTALLGCAPWVLIYGFFTFVALIYFFEVFYVVYRGAAILSKLLPYHLHVLGLSTFIYR